MNAQMRIRLAPIGKSADGGGTVAPAAPGQVAGGAAPLSDATGTVEGAASAVVAEPEEASSSLAQIATKEGAAAPSVPATPPPDLNLGQFCCDMA